MVITSMMQENMACRYFSSFNLFFKFYFCVLDKTKLQWPKNFATDTYILGCIN